MSDTIERHIALLGLVPVLPRKRSASELHGLLLAQGFEVNQRSTERDLHKLSRFGLVEDGGRPAGWSWAQGHRMPSFPPMSPDNALMLELVRRHLATILPPGVLKQLERPFEEARHILEFLGESPPGRWSESVAVLPDGPPLAPPEVAVGVLEAVGEALLRGRQLEAAYRAIGKSRARAFRFHPLGLVHRDGVFYLVATVDGYADIRNFALQRMRDARMLEQPSTRPEDFDLGAYLHQKRAFQWPHGEVVRLELKVDAWLAMHLGERCLADDQAITPLRGEPERSRVTATVAATEQLYWWLRSLGTSVEVVKPARLRKRLVEEIRQLGQMYAGDPLPT